MLVTILNILQALIHSIFAKSVDTSMFVTLLQILELRHRDVTIIVKDHIATK